MYNEQKANSVLTRENQNANNKSAEKAWKHNKSEISTNSHPEEEIERGCEEEREGFPVPIFPPQASELWDCWLAEWAFALKFQVF